MIKTVENGKVTAQIDTRGGQLLSLKKGETEYLWQRDPAFWSSCAPVLFPVVGRQRENRIVVEGRSYPMPMHGFLRDTELETVEEASDRLTLRLQSDEETKKMYPWDFSFQMTFALAGDTLTQSFVVENQDTEKLYFCLGGHPGFRVPLAEGEQFSEYQLIFEKDEPLVSDGLEGGVILPEETYELPREGNVLAVNEELFREGNTLIFENLQSSFVELTGPAGRGVRVSYEGFSTLAFWTKGVPDNAPFLCIEPWCGMGMRAGEEEEFSKKSGVISLMPGETYSAVFSIQVKS